MNKLGMCLLLIYFGILCYLIYNKKRNISFLLVYFATIIVSIPCYFSIAMLGVDTSVHLGRIAALTQTIADGYIPQRILTWVRMSYGWAAGVMYPQLFFYIPAFFGLIGKIESKVDIYNYANSFLIIIHILSAEFMYYSLKEIFKKKNIATIGSFLFVLMYHRIRSAYVIGQYGELLGIMCLPLYVLGLYYIFCGNTNKWFVLTIASTFILGSHLITTFLSALLTIVVILINIKSIIKREVLISLIKAYGFALLINVSFLIPLRDYINEKDLVTTPFKVQQVSIVPLENIFGFKDDAVGFLLLLCLIISLVIIILLYKNHSTEYNVAFIIYIISLISLLFCSAPFIMSNINKIDILRKLFANIQFARRWIGPISVCAIMSFSYFICEFFEKYKIKWGIVVAYLFVVIFSVPTIKTEIINYMHQNYSSNIHPNMNWSDYSYANTSMDYENVINGTINPSANVRIKNWEKKGLKVSFSYNIANKNITDNVVQVPLLYYPGYVAKDKNNNILEVYRDNNNLLNVKIKEPEGSIIVDFKGLPHWKYFDFISLISAIGFILLIIKENKKIRANIKK